MFAQVLTDVRAHGDDPQPFRTAGRERGYNQALAELVTSPPLGDLGVDQGQRPVGALVLEERGLAVHLQLESLRVPVVDHVV